MKLLLLPGDGVGPEIVEAALAVLDAVAARQPLELERETVEIGFAALAAHGSTLPEGVLERARAADGVVLGPIDHMRYPDRDQGGINVSAALRTGLDLYANIRPARTRPGLSGPVGAFDLVIMRENTEGFYPTATCTPAAASSCRTRIPRSRYARSAPPRAAASRAGRSPWRAGGAAR